MSDSRSEGLPNGWFSSWTLVTLLVPFVVGILMSFYISSLLLGVILLAAWWIAAVIALVQGLIHAAYGRWHSAAPRFLSSVISAVSPALIVAGLISGYYLHFFSVRTTYDQQIRQQQDNGRRFAIYEWDGYFIFNTVFVVFDETDEIHLPAGQQSIEWVSRVNNRTGGLFAHPNVWTSRRLQGHYYLVII